MTSTSAATAQPTVRLTGPASVVAALPHVLGFRPERSAVVFYLGGDRRTVRLTVRLDLPAADTNIGEWIDALMATGRYVESEEVIVVIIDEVDQARAPELPHEDLVSAIGSEFDDLGVEMVDAILVGTDAWWSYHCDNPQCCPPEGSSLEDAEAWRVKAEFALGGVAPLNSRDDVERRVAAASGVRVEAVAESVRFMREQERQLDAEELLELLELEADPKSGASTDPDVVASALVSLTDVMVRDAVIVHYVACVENDGPRPVAKVLGLLCEITRIAPVDVVPPVASVVAVLAWQSGDGALASCALERALDANPEYSLANLIDAMVRSGVPPQAVRAGLASLQVVQLPKF